MIHDNNTYNTSYIIHDNKVITNQQATLSSYSKTYSHLTYLF